MIQDFSKFGACNAAKPVSVAGLIGAEFNPDGRTTKGAVSVLASKVVEAGNRILVPIHVSRDGHIIDGHRRVTVARMLGIEEIPAIVWQDITYRDQRFGEMFLVFNEPVRKLTPRELLHTALKGGPANPEIARQRDQVQDLLTEGSLVFEKFIEKTAPFQVIQNAIGAANFLVKGDAAERHEQRRLTVKLVEFQIDLHQQQDLKLFLTEAVRESVSRPKRPRFSAKRLRDSLDNWEKLNLGN